MLQVNENLNKKVQELETRLTATNDDLKKTKEDLEKAQDIIKQYKEKNTNLEDRLFKYNKENVLQANAMSSKQKDVMIIFFNTIHYHFCIIIISMLIYYVYFTD